MSIRKTIEDAVDPARPKKSPRHLLLLPVAFGVTGACGYLFVVAASALAVLTRQEVQGFSTYSEPTKILIVIPLLLAAIPIGFLAANLLAWSIPPFRRFFDREARGRDNGSFSASMRGLLTFAKYWMPLLLAIGFSAALFGK